MPGPRLISVIGKKNVGKTTLVVVLVKELIRRAHPQNAAAGQPI